jgi:hypothetical protein
VLLFCTCGPRPCARVGGTHAQKTLVPFIPSKERLCRTPGFDVYLKNSPIYNEAFHKTWEVRTDTLTAPLG